MATGIPAKAPQLFLIGMFSLLDALLDAAWTTP